MRNNHKKQVFDKKRKKKAKLGLVLPNHPQYITPDDIVVMDIKLHKHIRND